MNQKSSSKRRNSKNSNRRFNPKDNVRSEDKVNLKKECANDPSWYIREGQLAKDVASLSFNTALGGKATINPSSNSSDFGILELATPGIMALHTVPIPGISRSAVSPINIAAKNLYSFVRHANSGHSNYDSPDLILYILAMDSIFNWIYHLQRVYGVAQVYSQKNRYIGDALMTAMGFQPNDVRNNLANFRAAINMLIVKASVFAIPNTMTLFKRHAWMYSNIFADSPVEKAQFYMYLPSVLHKYNETSGAGKLQAFETLVQEISGAMSNTAMMTTSAGITIANTMLGLLQASEDINIMSGDILKAYGRENLFTMGLIPENYVVVPMYSEEILDQIHNTVFCGAFPRATTMSPVKQTVTTYDIRTFDVIQDPSIGAGNLLCQPSFVEVPHLSYDMIIDMTENEPTPERVLVATRNTVVGSTAKLTFDGTDYWYTNITDAGSDLCLFATYYYNNPSTGVLTNGAAYRNSSGHGTAVLSKIDKFHKAPLTLYGSYVNSAYVPAQPFGSLEDFTIVSEDVLSKIHQSAILSMLGVPV